MKSFLPLLLLLASVSVEAREVTIASPNGKLVVTISDEGGLPTYAVSLDGQPAILPSALGFKADFGDLTHDLAITRTTTRHIDHTYDMWQVKQSHFHYVAEQLEVEFKTTAQPNGAQKTPARPNGSQGSSLSNLQFSIEFSVSDNSLAFRYLIPRQANDNPKSAVIFSEATSFRLPEGTTTFLTPQSDAMIGWERTKPSYEEEYRADAPMDTPSQYGHGYTFPCLFGLPPTSNPAAASTRSLPKGKGGSAMEHGMWVLISETGVSSAYCGSHLSDYHPLSPSDTQTLSYPSDTQTPSYPSDTQTLSSLNEPQDISNQLPSLREGQGVGPGVGYSIAYPLPGENNGRGDAFAGIPLPGSTPWRTIAVGTTLKPIVETTIPYDVVEPLYPLNLQSSIFNLQSSNFQSSIFNLQSSNRYTWSWLIWQDNSINYDDQVRFIDLAAAMGYESCLVDNWWDQNIGRERIAELSRYAQSKGVSLMLWYNSNGFENDAPQTPRDCMSTAIARDREMAWLQSIGVRGIKVDFFGGDKQETMRLYEDILYDANRYGICCIFHGCTLPRGWERMYPNYVASEAVLASENVYFSEGAALREPFDLTMHPFCRNAVGAMDWGGVIMNRYMSKDNRSRHTRKTTDVFEIASAFTNQTAVQCIAMQPNNLQELDSVTLSFLRHIPTTWDETRFLDGYPGRYVVLARRHGSQWYVAGLNALKEPLTLTLDLSDLPLTTVLTDQTDRQGHVTGVAQSPLKLKKGKARLTIQPNGGVVVY